jgi:hypothetical protein
MHPAIAKTLIEQRHEELVRHTAQNRRGRRDSHEARRLSRHLPHWHVSWSRAVLSPAGTPGTTDSSQERQGKRGSSLVIIISAYRSA